MQRVGKLGHTRWYVGNTELGQVYRWVYKVIYKGVYRYRQGRRKDLFVAEERLRGAVPAPQCNAMQTKYNHMRMSIFSVFIKNTSYNLIIK